MKSSIYPNAKYVFVRNIILVAMEKCNDISPFEKMSQGHQTLNVGVLQRSSLSWLTRVVQPSTLTVGVVVGVVPASASATSAATASPVAAAARNGRGCSDEVAAPTPTGLSQERCQKA